MRGERLNESHNVRCQAFARCENAAVGAIEHPVLGFYLSCQRCADRLEVGIRPVQVTEQRATVGSDGSGRLTLTVFR